MVNEKTHFYDNRGEGLGERGKLKEKIEKRRKEAETKAGRGKTFDGKGKYTNTREGIKTMFKTTFILF